MMATSPVRATRSWWPNKSATATNERPASPAARKSADERLLCNAISGHWLVELRHPDLTGWRRFAPHAVFRSASGHVNVSVVDPEADRTAEGGDRPEILEVGRLAGLRLVAEQFDPDPLFDRASALHEGGVICSV